MHFTATIANALWAAANFAATQRFERALQNPIRAQQTKLLSLIRGNAASAFGRAHHFHEIRNYEGYIQRVPIADYSTLEPWIGRIRDGEPSVLTRDRVSHLVPTSGSSGGRKLIPFTRALQSEFNAAIAPWMFDLCRKFPKILGGPAYWSITPALQSAPDEDSRIPIGFQADTEYLAGARRVLADAILAVPAKVGRAQSLESFHYQTWSHLLRCRDLRLISVWHPSFLTLLLDALPPLWNELQNKIAHLKNANPNEPRSFWPHLELISCWGDAAAAPYLRELKKRFPTTAIQPKGLIATECFVTIPYRDQYPAAITSHFFEFIEASGAVRQLQELEAGGDYEIIVTTSGGLWRYRLGDRVRVTGSLHETPTLQFLGRGDAVSDRFGEKLSEEFAAAILGELFCDNAPAFAMLAPDQDETGCRYILYFEAESNPPRAEILDQALRENPHYAYCRDLGQLQAAKVIRISNGYQTFAAHQSNSGSRLGDIKPKALSRETGWSTVFNVDQHFQNCAPSEIGK